LTAAGVGPEREHRREHHGDVLPRERHRRRGKEERPRHVGSGYEEVVMKIIEVGDFNDPYRRVKFAVKGDVARKWEEPNSLLPEVGERVCLDCTDDWLPFGCLATCTAIDESETGDGRSILIAKFREIEGTFGMSRKSWRNGASRLSSSSSLGSNAPG
jgi:hypothetical protein